jgi:NAD(P)-dependent dehydrogenase (short-subunit alcohol dehydrogenase family)
MHVDGIAAVVTGGASGLGEATARALAAAGARVTILDLDDDRGHTLASELGGGAQFVHTDVTNADQVAAAVEAASTAGAPLRLAVNCAGIAIATRTIARDGTPHDLGAFERVIRINLIGTFNVLRVAASAIASTDPLDDGERGLIVNTASVAAFEGQIGQVAYAASKGGVVGMTLPAARDLASVGIRVCTVAPGTFETPMMSVLPPEARDALAANIPFPHRLGRPHEYAALVCHLAENSMINGEVIRVDGALRMPPK